MLLKSFSRVNAAFNLIIWHKSNGMHFSLNVYIVCTYIFSKCFSEKLLFQSQKIKEIAFILRYFVSKDEKSFVYFILLFFIYWDQNFLYTFYEKICFVLIVLCGKCNFLHGTRREILHLARCNKYDEKLYPQPKVFCVDTKKSILHFFTAQ